MKISAEDVIPGASSVLEGSKVVFEFDTTVRFREKQQLNELVIKNGGVVSYILTKQCSFLLVSSAEKAASYRCQMARKYGVPVLAINFLTDSVSAGKILDFKKYSLGGDTSVPKTTEAVISAAIPKPSVKDETKRDLKIWHPTDNNLPVFSKDNFELAKYAVFQKGKTTFYVLEIHVNKDIAIEDSPRFRVFYQISAQGSNTVEYRFSDSAEDALYAFHSLGTKITCDPQCNRVEKGARIPVDSLGTEKFRKMYRDKQSKERPSAAVTTLAHNVWREAIGKLEDVLSVPTRNIKLEQVEKAEGILLQIKESLLVQPSMKDLQNLSAQFYEAIPHKQRPTIANKTMLSRKEDICQLIRDMDSVGEETHWLDRPAADAQYKALCCHLEHVRQIDIDYDLISNMVLDSIKDAKIVDVFTVRRPVEDDVFQRDLGSTKLLFHSSKPPHYLGILSRGLLLPKFVVSDNGEGNLGQGMYFAQEASVSSKYSVRNPLTGSRYMLVCEVALGRKAEVFSPQFDLTCPPQGYHSVHGVAATPQRPSFFKDDEYVVYDSSQQRLRYLVEYLCPNDRLIEPKEEPSQALSPPNYCPIDYSTLQHDVEAVTAVEDPLSRVESGLLGPGSAAVPLKAVHIRARLLDLSAQVVVLQTYRNDENAAIEAKYVFPLDDLAAVCGFEAFINGKHVVGQVKEKAQAHREYKEAVKQGHGAYLMDQDTETPDVFTVSVGNLPPKATVLIKITYVVELQTEAGLINFSIPASVAPWKRDQAQQETTQTSVETVKVESAVAEDTSLQVSVNMPFDIKSIDSPTHTLRIKSTACRAVLELEKNQSLEGGFQLLIGLSQIHVPRMWVEEHPDDPDSQACMLTFYPEVDNIASQVSEITLLLDMSNSMDGKPAKDAVTLVLLLLAQLDKNTKFNVIVFGTESEEVFHQPEDASEKNKKRFSEFMKKNVTVTLGGTDLYTPLHRLLLLQPSSSPLNVLLLSDGHISNEQLIFSDLLNSVTTLRLFTLGISETANRHRLRSLARVGRGAFEYFDNKVKSKWETKVKSVLYRVSQPSLSSVQVEWHQYDNDPLAPIQAPRQIMSLFSGSRQVVYGFVPNCQMATLKAVVDGKEVSTVVSSSDLSNTKGLILHRLTARGLIRDWEDGILAFDRSKHEAEKMGIKDYIIGISKEYAIVTQLTSFVAVEERTKDEKFVTDPGHQLEELLQAEAVDDLQYMGWQTLQAKAPTHQREAEIELEVEEQGCFDPESMSDDRSDESLSDEGSDESLYDEESDEASSDDLCGFCLYEDDSVTASAFSSGGGVGSPLSQENGIEDIAEQCGFMDQGPWLPVEDEMLHCNKMGFIAQDIDSTFGECEYNEEALMSSHSRANVLAAPSAPQELDTFDTPVLKANENTSSLAYLSPGKATYLSIEKKAVDKSISSLMSDTIDKVKERSEDLKSLVEKSVNLSEGLECFSKSSVQKHEKTDKKKTGIFASKPESLKLPKGRRMGGRPSAAAMSSNEAHPKTQQIPLSRPHVATGAVDLFDIQPAMAPPLPRPPRSQIPAQFAMSAPSAIEPTAPHPVSEDFCRKGSFKLSKVETLPTAHSKPPPPPSSIDMIRTSLAPAVPVRKSQLSAMAASVPVEPKPTMVKTKPLESPASQGLDSVVTASQDMLCASRRRQTEGRSISRYLCSLSRKSLRNKQLQSFGGPQQPLDRAAFAESDYQPEEHFLSLDISMKASSDSQPIKEAAPEPLKKASKVMCSSGSRGGRASIVHRKVMSDVPKNQPLLDSSLLPQGVIMNEKAKTGIQALSKSVSFMSFDTVFKAQRNDGSWEFCPSVFTELMMDYDNCRNTLYSAGLKSLGWRVEQAIFSLAATAIVLGQFLSFLLPHQFPSILQLTDPNFQLDIDKEEAQEQIRKALDGYTDNSAAVYAVVMRAVRFCEETINAHPMVCSQLELGRSWEYFLANINGFMDNKASMF